MVIIVGLHEISQTFFLDHHCGDQILLMRADGSDGRAITNTADVLHTRLNWSPDGKYLLYDLYLLDAFPFQSRLQVIGIESGDIKDLEIKGFTPQWMWK